MIKYSTSAVIINQTVCNQYITHKPQYVIIGFLELQDTRRYLRALWNGLKAKTINLHSSAQQCLKLSLTAFTTPTLYLKSRKKEVCPAWSFNTDSYSILAKRNVHHLHELGLHVNWLNNTVFWLVEGFSREKERKLGTKIFVGWNFLDLIFLLLLPFPRCQYPS